MPFPYYAYTCSKCKEECISAGSNTQEIVSCSCCKPDEKTWVLKKQLHNQAEFSEQMEFMKWQQTLNKGLKQEQEDREAKKRHSKIHREKNFKKKLL